MLSQESMKKLLSEIKTIAIVGAKDKPGQPVDDVARHMMRAGYTIIPVHPKRSDVWGLTTYTDLAALPQVPDAVVLFRASEHCAAHAREVLAMPGKPKVFWMQLGITNDEAMKLMEEAGITAVQNKCIKVEHQKLFGAGIGLGI